MQLLPLSVGMFIFLLFLSIGAYKWWCLRRKRTQICNHHPTLLSALLVLFYFLYLYLTRTTFDVFHCAPTSPPDGKMVSPSWLLASHRC